MRGRMVHPEGGAAELLPYGNRPEEVIYSVSRAALNKILMDAAEEAGATPDGSVRLRFVRLRLQIGDIDRNRVVSGSSGRFSLPATLLT